MKIGRTYLKLILLSFPILLYLGWKAFVFIQLEVSSIKNKRKVERVEIGMTKTDVIEIMGRPRNVHLSFINGVDSMYFYLPPSGRSEGIFIQFDSAGRVNEIEK